MVKKVMQWDCIGSVQNDVVPVLEIWCLWAVGERVKENWVDEIVFVTFYPRRSVRSVRRARTGANGTSRSGIASANRQALSMYEAGRI